jgi:hypothetical protein
MTVLSPANASIHAESDPCRVETTACRCPKGEGTGTDPLPERPGYNICGFAEGLVRSPVGEIVQVKTGLDTRDRLGTLLARSGLARFHYTVAPGLYAVGLPGPDSPVLVTANYKLTFDRLRTCLKGANAWLLVLNTRGINVWCAAGKGTFGTDEVVRRVRETGLDRVVNHRRLILPQYGATGVCGRKVQKRTGFKVVWGPVRVKDLQRFLDADQCAEPGMRRPTFTLAERAVLIPVEVVQALHKWPWVLLALFLLSGVGSSIFSVSAAWNRGLVLLATVLAGVLAGSALVPAFLPWLPGRAFACKGAVAGIAAGTIPAAWYGAHAGVLEAAALLLAATAIGSYRGMAFTGCTPYTSPSGVEKEMRRAIPLQAGGAFLAAVLWVLSGFVA